MNADIHSTWIDHIPAIWLEPRAARPDRRLAIFLNWLGGSKENLLPYLTDLAHAGFYALSFDCWEHGERSGTSAQVGERTFGNFRRHMWVNIGQTALDTLRVIDWAVAGLAVEPQVCMGGLSMGGDIAVAAAGIDARIRRVAAVGATPDWLRPGMLDFRVEGHPPLPVGTPDAYARYFYEQFNPITHLAHYTHAPEIYFFNGEKDDHVPPEASQRFKSALAELYPAAAEKVTISLLPGLDHGGLFSASTQWWPAALDWLSQPL